MGIVADIVTLGTQRLGITLPLGACDAFESYYALLDENGKNFNLTAITGCDDVARLHFIDSLAILGAVDFENARVIDVGSGAGFPGIPLKIAAPSIDLTLLDATGKRVDFMSRVCDALGFEASCVHARAEDASRRPDMRERFDVAVSRAVARLDVLCELCLPFLRVGGAFLAMKGSDSVSETHDALGAMGVLGARLDGVFEYVLPEVSRDIEKTPPLSDSPTFCASAADISRCVAVIRKISETPPQYPRRFAKIQKSPLR